MPEAVKLTRGRGVSQLPVPAAQPGRSALLRWVCGRAVRRDANTGQRA